jgi:TonB family protein
MDSGIGETRNTTSPRAAEPELRLLTELSSWRRELAENLRDTLLRRQPERVWTTSPPGKFWPDVFVPHGVPWKRMCESGTLHVLAIAMLVSFTNVYLLLQRRTVKLAPPASILHYQVSEYLPPINTGSPPAPKPRKGRPLLAKQQIISLPPRPDNFEQTIISPVDVKLPVNVPLPNIVAWTPVPGPPSAGAFRDTDRLKLPQLPVIAPPPQAQELEHRALPQMARQVIGPAPQEAALAPDQRLDQLNRAVIGPPPAPDTAKLRTPRDIIAVTPAVLPPPPNANLSENVGAMNIGKLLPTGTDPKLVVPPQQAMQLPEGTHSLRAGVDGGGGAGGGASAPPQVALQGALAKGPIAGQLIALNLHPAVPTGPLNVPPGRRTGEFAVGPEGKADAPGTPEIKGGGTGAGGSGNGPSGPGSKSNNALPSGIIIGSAPNAPSPGSVAVQGIPQKSVTNPFDAQQVLSASARPPRIGDVPPETTRTGASARIEDKIFSGKKSYALALNMPNLSSAGGSWIIHFAELDNDHSAGELTAPVATTMVDPAYPAELIRRGIEGTVVLYAVIRKDGTVGDVRILRGLQVRLDDNARTALMRWKFRPATKNGQAIDLEAVVQIPYKVGRLDY